MLGWLASGDHTTVLPGVGPRPTPKNYAELARALREAAAMRASSVRVPPHTVTTGRVETAGAPQNLVEGLSYAKLPKEVVEQEKKAISKIQ